MKALLLEDYADYQGLLTNITCPSSNSTDVNSTAFLNYAIRHSLKDDLYMFDVGLKFYSFITPFIILTGIVGNLISLRVFMSRRMRQMSASLYLAALASSDTLVLTVFVFVDWLHRGLPSWTGKPDGINLKAISGLCQSYLYISYIFRFLSAWIIVLFTGERFIGVCKPLHRRAMCTNSFAKRAIVSIMVVAGCISAYKPMLVAVREHADGTRRFCSHQEGMEKLSYILDALYASLITVLPFTIITCLNFLIMRRLRLTRQRHLRAKFASEESTIRLEFTAILMVVSTTFILLNLPYFVMWCYNFEQRLSTTLLLSNPTQGERTRGWLYITKTIFYGNYCVNFFIYSLTGGYFRKQLRALFPDCCPGFGPATSRPSGTGFNGNVPNTSTSHIPLQSRGL